MDTRSKIVTIAEAAAALRSRGPAPAPRVAAGFFDPLLAVHARRLAAAAEGGKLIVVVADPENPILPQRARVELVAALDCVEYVVPACGAAEDALAQLGRRAALNQCEADARSAGEFVERVRGRQPALR
ncbi:MAG: hypothetical protein KIT09_25295 [Bryobacteraceae bacterium]|nr:hypothetical protein [Bryobacteraceae bacterium]